MQTAQSILRALTYLLHQSTGICLRIDKSATNRHFKNSIGNDSSPSPWHHGHAEKGIGDESSIPLSPFRDWSSPVMLCSRKVHSIIGDHPSRKLTELKRWALKHFPVLWELTFVVKTHWSRPSALGISVVWWIAYKFFYLFTSLHDNGRSCIHQEAI